MIWGGHFFIARFAAFAIAALLALVPAQLAAQNAEGTFSIQSGLPCHTAAQPGEAIGDIADDRGRWTCDGAVGVPPDAQQIVIRFDLRGADLARPGLLINTHTYRQFDRFARFQIYTVGTEAITGSGWLSIDDLPPTSPVWKTRIEAPPAAGAAQAIMVRIDAPENAAAMDRFELEDTAPRALLANAEQMLAALLCGLLLAPALIGIVNFRALRSRFAIYHVFYCLLAVVQVATLGGLLPLVVDLSREMQFFILHVSFDLITAISAIFAASVIERDKLDRRSKQLLHGAALLAIMLGSLRVMLGLIMADERIAQIYYAGYVIFLAMLAVALIYPLRHRSRAGLFLLVGFLPLIVIGCIRIALALGTQFEITFHSVLLQHFALVWQVFISAVAVADRFLTIRRERDRARTSAQLLEQASERDTLTGVYNRRIIAQRYDRLQQEGFASLALVDLDHFKTINDTFGHTAGDRVLRAVAEALDPDPNTIVVRMGGEEFALLMRGTDILARAERRRSALAQAASRALGNAHAVTASMGVIEIGRNVSHDLDFEALYDRADRLLYEAKNAGRNRTISERLQGFQPRRKERRAGNRRAA